MKNVNISSQLSYLDRNLFVSLRPYESPDHTSWIDPVDPSIANMVTEEQARFGNYLPFQRIENIILIAAADPDIPEVISVIEYIEGKVVLCRAEKEDIKLAQDRIYGYQPSTPDKKLGSYLLSQGKISSSQLVASLKLQMEEASGAKIGSILLEQGLVTHWDVAEAYARQKGIPAIDLISGENAKAFLYHKELGPIWDWVDHRFWYRHLTVPLAINDDTLTIAMVDPDDQEAINNLSGISNRKLRIFVTGYRDVMSILNLRYHTEHEEASRLDLVNRRPEDSAIHQISRRQAIIFIVLALVMILGFIFQSQVTGTVIAGIIELMYALVSIFRLWAMTKAASQDSEIFVSKADMDAIPPTSLPAYTILVPLYKEASVLPTLAKAMKELQYPKDRLDVKFLLEEDDEETIEACRAAHLPPYVELLIVPDSQPRTKPKACNYGLTKARGEYVVIFDAEDIPDPDQLLKAITIFRQSDDNMACVQAKLSYYNENQNILTRWFTSEYANWFELLLPSLYGHDMPVPLGGTSNHLRTDVVREMGAWDPYNVAEDADLGVRLHKAGYRTAVMDSITFEEANSDFVNWVRQRSRWVKGYLQTWLVHMRHPVKLWKELGMVGFWGFQMTIGGTPLQFLINPILWAITILWFLFQPNYMHEVFSGWIYYVGNLCLFLGNTSFIMANLVGVIKAKRWSLAIWTLLTPIYWVFMSIASYKALNQLIFKPSYWEKTIHGLAKNQSLSPIDTQGTSQGLPL